MPAPRPRSECLSWRPVAQDVWESSLKVCTCCFPGDACKEHCQRQRAHLSPHPAFLPDLPIPQSAVTLMQLGWACWPSFFSDGAHASDDTLTSRMDQLQSRPSSSRLWPVPASCSFCYFRRCLNFLFNQTEATLNKG